MTEFRLASRDDDALLRRLLRENSMPSWVEMSIEREPSFFAASENIGGDWAVIAEEDGQPFGMYAAAVMPTYVGGRPTHCGYLGGLRIQSSERQRIRHLRNGYASIRRLAPVLPDLPWWFTVIAAENTRARRVLEAGLRGLPRYRPLGGMTTYAMASAHGRRHGLWRRAAKQDVQSMLAFHAEHASCHLLAPVLTVECIERIGLGCFWLHQDQGRIISMAALWNQCSFKQVVAQRYHPYLQAGLPVYNCFARLTRRVALPKPGHALSQSFISYLALHPDALGDTERMHRLMADLLSLCATPVAAIGLRDGHPLTPVVQRFKPLRYQAVVYAVEFDESAQLDGRPVQPEVALL